VSRYGLVCATIGVLAGAISVSAQTPTFTGGVAAVVIPVAVERDRRPVTGLTLVDFELRDNGVVQSIADLSVDLMPLDITLLVDMSASMGFPARIPTAVETGIRDFRQRLRPQDRLRLVQFAMQATAVEDVASRTPRAVENRRTRLLDSLSLAVLAPRSAGHRRVVIAVTDGLDNTSAVDDRFRTAVFERGDATVVIVGIEQRTMVDFYRWDNWRLRDVVARTGGRLIEVFATDDFGPPLARAIEFLRSAYLLRYIPTGVPADGWHRVEVSLKQGRGVQLSAKQGYFVAPVSR